MKKSHCKGSQGSMGLKPIATKSASVFKARSAVFKLKIGNCASLSPLLIMVRVAMCSAQAGFIVDVGVN